MYVINPQFITITLRYAAGNYENVYNEHFEQNNGISPSRIGMELFEIKCTVRNLNLSFEDVFGPCIIRLCISHYA